MAQKGVAVRRIQTDRVPEMAERSRVPIWWDFRPGPDGWILEIPMHDPGGSQSRPARPEQGRWLAERGLVVDNFGRVTVHGDALTSLADALDPVRAVEPGWAGYEALDAVIAAQLAGDADGADALSKELSEIAPTWVIGRRKRLEILIQVNRDADQADAELDALVGILEPDELRRERQTVALLRDDWATYADMQAEMISDGLREAWAYEVLGLARWAAGALDLALVALQTGQEAHPGHRELALREAEVLAAMGRGVEALDLLNRLAAEGPPHSKTIALRGWQRRLTDPQAAAEDYEEALALDPEQAVARVGRGLMRLSAGDREGARADLAPFSHCGWTEAAEAWRRFKAEGP